MQRILSFARRMEALVLCAAVLWLVAVTAGSKTVRAAAAEVRDALPQTILRWELGDIWVRDTLSPAAVMTLSASPLLSAARPAVAELWSSEREEAPQPQQQEESVVTVPVEETPLEAPHAPDNGVPARTLVPSGTAGYTVLGRTYISNTTDYDLSDYDLSQPFAAELTGEGGPQILILHTHGSEAYTPADDTGIVWSGDHRTTDSRYNVVKIGDEMADVFSDAGISVLHDRTLYDYPEYSGSYDRSLAAIQSYLAQYPSIRFVLDVHRDAIEDGEGKQYKVVAPIDATGQTAAQMTLVVGTDGSGLTHPNWVENLRLATALQEQLLTEHPSLMRPVLLRNSRYNQHATTGSLLIEVGAAGNSPEEALLAARLAAEGMVEILAARSK